LNAEILELTNKLNDSERKFTDLDGKFKKIKEKYQKASDSVMGTATELDKLKNEKAQLEAKLSAMETEMESVKATAVAPVPVEETPAPQVKDDSEIEKENKDLKEKIEAMESEKNNLKAQLSAEKDHSTSLMEEYNKKLQEIKEENEKLSNAPKSAESIDDESIKEKKTGVISSLSQYLMVLKLSIPETRRTIRIVVPQFSDFEKFGIMELIKGLPVTILKNIGCSFNFPDDQAVVSEMSTIGYKFTNLKECNLFSFSIDDVEAGLAIKEDGDNITGFFSKNPLLVPILNQAVMSQFIRGDKIQ
jgi:septation ring formation regulator EzrA